MKLKEKFSERLLHARDVILRISQPEMAERLGLQERQYINYENGLYDDKQDLVKKYSKRLEETLTKHEVLNAMPMKQSGDVGKRLTDLEKKVDDLTSLVIKLTNRMN